MNYFIERGRNTETAVEMNEVLQCANALCGFNSCVTDILEKKKYEKQKQISNISKIHTIKYIYDGNNVSYKTWQYYGIGSGKVVACGTEPSIPHHNVKSTFSNQCKSFGMVTTKQAKKGLPESSFHCTDPMYVQIFSYYELLKNHLDFGKPEYEKMNTTQMGTVAEKWLKRYVEGNEKGNPREIANDEHMEHVRENRGSDQSSLGMGWTIPICNCRPLNDRQRTFFNKLFDDGERTGNKLTAQEKFYGNTK